jgi:Mg/Co/Ni transporter MgtE
MSSSASAKTLATAPVVARGLDPVPDPASNLDDTDRTYGRAILAGAGAGIVLFIVAVAAVVKALAPDWPMGAVVGIAVWTGAWTGLFLGGTVAVGRWSLRQGH